jgi:polyhydroxyalkanoate synthesis regulator phasin
MVLDALRGYVQLASGMTEVSRKKAEKAAKALLKQTGADTLTTKVSDLADEIVATSKSNRQLLQAIVANEVEGAVARLGFVRSEEVAALTRRVKALETELAEAHAAASERAAVEKSAPGAGNDAPAKAAAKKPAKKAAAKKTAKKA